MTTEQQQHTDVLDEEQLDELQDTPAGLSEADFRGCRWHTLQVERVQGHTNEKESEL